MNKMIKHCQLFGQWFRLRHSKTEWTIWKSREYVLLTTTFSGCSKGTSPWEWEELSEIPVLFLPGKSFAANICVCFCLTPIQTPWFCSWNTFFVEQNPQKNPLFSSMFHHFCPWSPNLFKGIPENHFPHVFFSTGAGLRRAPRAPPPSAACQTPRGPGRAGDVRRAPRSRSRSSCEDSPNLQIQTNYLWKVFFGIIIHTHTHIYIYIYKYIHIYIYI